jgi:glutamate/aspartate transport system substrate-binding protein
MTMKTWMLVAMACCVTTQIAAAEESTLAKIKASQSITLGVRDSSIPLSYTGGDGQPIGFQMDICKQIVSAIQTQLGLPKLDVKYQTVNSQNRVVLVQNGTVDLECGSTTNNQARARDAAFSVTTYIEEDRMAVRADSGIRNLRDLSGKTVVATTGTTAIQHLRQYERAAGLNWTDLYGKDHADSFLMLESGRADAWVLDQGVLRATIAISRNPAAYTVTGEPFNTEPIAVMFRKDDPDFKKVVDGTIRKMDASGEMKTLWSKWFVQPIPPRGIRMNMEPPEALVKLWAQPNDLPMESYAAR